MQAAENELHEMHSIHKMKLQPFVIINGPSLNDIRFSLVVIENYKYQVTLPVAAVDLCFQSIKILGEKFSPVCNHVWQFIEREVFKFEVKDLYNTVTTVIENMQKL